MRRMYLVLICSLMLLLAAGQAMAKDNLVPKVDSFVLFLDYSGSMGMTNADLKQTKIKAALDLLDKTISQIPELAYIGSLATFAPFEEIAAPAKFAQAPMGKALASVNPEYEIFNRMTPMGNGLEDLSAVIGQMKGRKAVIIYSDGMSNQGSDPVEQAQRLYAQYPNLCFHVVSFADTAEGQATLDSIAALKGCTVSAKATELQNPAALAQFVKDVFYDVEKAEAEEAAPAMEQVIELRGVQFDLDSAKIRADMAPILDEAAAILKSRTGSVMLEGHTCILGSDAHNMKLSQQRALAVKAYLVKQGVDASRLTAVGYGETRPKYDNSTDQGRRMNRRVELRLE